MNTWKAVLISIVALSGLPAAQAASMFTDNFNAENGGAGTLNYNSFANWDVTDGTVDLIGTGFYDLQPGNGLYVDLDGSSWNIGRLTTKSAFSFAPGTNYSLSFFLAGNLRGWGDDSVRVMIDNGIFSQDIKLGQNAPFTQYMFSINVLTELTGKLSFEGLPLNTGDNVGLLLDNVSLSSNTTVRTPDAASTAILFGSAFLVLAIARRRRAA